MLANFVAVSRELTEVTDTKGIEIIAIKKCQTCQIGNKAFDWILLLNVLQKAGHANTAHRSNPRLHNSHFSILVSKYCTFIFTLLVW
jgi:hypothetical protein